MKCVEGYDITYQGTLWLIEVACC